MNYLTYIIILLVAIIIIFIFTKKYKTEHYNDQTGKFCLQCKHKNINECLRCFNCGWCVDENGNGACIPGDYKGPANYEKCKRWYSEFGCSKTTNPVWYNKSKFRGRTSQGYSDYAPYFQGVDTKIDATCKDCLRWYHGDPWSYMLQHDIPVYKNNNCILH